MRPERVRGVLAPMTRRFPLFLLALAGCAPRPPQTPPAPPPQPITLDLDDPVIDATIDGVALRLRVDFQQKDVIELNPAAAARLPVAWEDGFEIAIGRVVLPGRQARAAATIGGIAVTTVVAEHGRDCCAGADGAISPALLPYDPVRLVRRAALAGGTQRLTATLDSDFGLAIPEHVGRETLRVRLALDGEAVVATAAAGAILARAYGGSFDGPVFAVHPAFGVARQARTMRFARPPVLAGFALRELAVRFADFSGGRALPLPVEAPGDIEVRGRAPAAQRDWPSLALGRAQLDRCREIAYSRAAGAVTLDCRFAP